MADAAADDNYEEGADNVYLADMAGIIEDALHVQDGKADNPGTATCGRGSCGRVKGSSRTTTPKMTRAKKIVATVMAAAAKGTAADYVGYYYTTTTTTTTSTAAPESSGLWGAVWGTGVFVATIAAAYVYGVYVGKQAGVKKRNGDEKWKVDKDIGDETPKEKIKQGIKDKSTETDEVTQDDGEPAVICYEEVRDVACQSQVTYLRKRVQPRFMPMPFHEGAYPDPARMKEVF